MSEVERDIRQAERRAIVLWLRRRSAMARSTRHPFWHWRKRLRVKHMAGLFEAAALSISNDIHHLNFEEETKLLSQLSAGNK